MPARILARSIILSRSAASACLLSLSRSAGIDVNADSIAMSFASAKLTFISSNSCSILSNVRLDKSFSKSVSGLNYRAWVAKKQRRSRQIAIAESSRPTTYFCFGSVGVILRQNTRPAVVRSEAALRIAPWRLLALCQKQPSQRVLGSTSTDNNKITNEQFSSCEVLALLI